MIKNKVERSGLKNCLKKDAAALCQFFGILEDEIVNKNNTTLTEFSVTKILSKLRA